MPRAFLVRKHSPNTQIIKKKLGFDLKKHDATKCDSFICEPASPVSGEENKRPESDFPKKTEVRTALKFSVAEALLKKDPLPVAVAAVSKPERFSLDSHPRTGGVGDPLKPTNRSPTGSPSEPPRFPDPCRSWAWSALPQGMSSQARVRLSPDAGISAQTLVRASPDAPISSQTLVRVSHDSALAALSLHHPDVTSLSPPHHAQYHHRLPLTPTSPPHHLSPFGFRLAAGLSTSPPLSQTQSFHDAVSFRPYPVDPLSAFSIQHHPSMLPFPFGTSSLSPPRQYGHPAQPLSPPHHYGHPAQPMSPSRQYGHPSHPLSPTRQYGHPPQVLSSAVHHPRLPSATPPDSVCQQNTSPSHQHHYHLESASKSPRTAYGVPPLPSSARLQWTSDNHISMDLNDINTFSGEKKRKRESEAPRYQCEACQKSYSTLSGLSKHKQFHCITQVKKQFSCKYCEKTYVSLGALKMHIRTHTLPCKCTLCGKAFSRPWLLQGHLRTHTGEKPFSCNKCGRAFADRSNLRAHLQTHSDIKKYSCKSCSKTFSRMSLLLKHEDGGCTAIIH